MEVNGPGCGVPIRATVRGASVRDQEAGPLVLAVVFAAENTLAPTPNLADVALGDVQEVIRPYSGALRTVRELHGLGIPLTLAGDAPEPVLKRFAQVVWLEGDVIAATQPLTAIVTRVPLPPACIWFITSDETQGRAARDLALNVVLIDGSGPQSWHAPDARGYYVARAIEDLLEIIRIPYTRSALNLRYILRKIMDAPGVDELVR